jgi:hypothetical protein
MKNIYLLFFEMISDKDQKFNANIIDTMFLLQIDLKINEILNSVQNQSILNSSIEDESQSQSLTKSKRNKQSMIMFADAMIMNIRFRKQTYSIALITIEALKSFHAAFSIDLKRLNQKKSQISKLHKDDLLVESRYWKQMLRHRFFQKFQMIAQKKIFELKKQITFSWIEKANQSRISLIWVFKYKLTSTTIWKNSRHDYVSEMIFNRLIKTRMQSRWLLKRFVFWWSFRLFLILKFNNMMRSMLSSIMKLMKNYTTNVRTNFLALIIVENWIRFCTS